MKRQLVMAALSAVILAALIITYNIMRNKDKPAETITEPEQEAIVLINKAKIDITKVKYVNEKASFDLLPQGELWYLSDLPELKLNQSAIESIITPMFYLSPYEKLLDGADVNLEDFGINDKSARASAYYADNTEITLYIGSLTPAGDFYYLMKEGDPAIYLLLKSYGDRFKKSLNDIIDKTLPRVDFASAYHINIKIKNGAEVELKYSPIGDNADASKAAFKEQMQEIGETTLKMLKPYPGRDVYLSTLMSQLEGFNGYALGELIEIDCEDLSKYGLNYPELIICIEGVDETLELWAGDYADAENQYVITADSNNVFLMSASYLTPFKNMNAVKFIERYAISPLPNIGTVDHIVITSSEDNRNHNIRLNHADNPPLEDGTGDIAPTVDGILTDGEEFRLFYRAVLGVTIDADAGDYEITGGPVVTIGFYFHTNREDYIIELYPYDTNFYALRLPGIDSPFLAGKQNVRIMFEYLDGLM